MIALGVILAIVGIGLGVLAIIDNTEQADMILPFCGLLAVVGILMAFGAFVFE